MKSAIITGGNGYIGSHMAKHLHSQGWKVTIIDNHSTSPREMVHNFGEFYDVDISDRVQVESILEKERPNAVFHFASRALVGESQSHPMLYYNEILVKTLKLIESCVSQKVPHFIFSSTCATFGVHSEKISEHSEQNPINTYGKAKLMVEKVLMDLAEKKMLKSCALRYFNAVGSDPEMKIGENHEHETHLIPNLCLAALSGSREFSILGSEHKTPDGTCVRDYIHVEDLALAHELAYRNLEANSAYWNAFNLGTGRGHSVLEVLETFEKVTGKELKKVVRPARDGDPASLVASPEKSMKELGFEPQYSLEDSILHTWKWFNSEKANALIQR